MELVVVRDRRAPARRGNRLRRELSALRLAAPGARPRRPRRRRPPILRAPRRPLIPCRTRDPYPKNSPWNHDLSCWSETGGAVRMCDTTARRSRAAAVSTPAAALPRPSRREGGEMATKGITRRGLIGAAAAGAAVAVGTFPTYNTGNNVFYGPRGREEYPNDTPFGTAPVDPVVDPDIVLAVSQLDQMSTSVPVDTPWTSSSAEEWDRQTLDTWLRQHTSGSDEFMALSAAATEAIFGCEPRELSLLYTLFYIAASGNEQ